VVIWLDAPDALLLERLSSDPTPRPLLQTEDPAARLAALLAERKPLYAQADLHIVQDGRTADQVAVQILEALPGVLKERTAAPQHRLQVVNDDGEVSNSIN
jgi:shikimate kinase